MKTILTLAFAIAFSTTLFAQKDAGKEEMKRVILGEKKGSTSYPKSGDERDVYGGRDDRTVYGNERNRRYEERDLYGSRERQIYEINRRYDIKIRSIENNRALSRSERERIIRQLEADRRREINRINDRHNGNDRDDDYKKPKKGKGNNGNHYGWSKGKGHPHR